MISYLTILIIILAVAIIYIILFTIIEIWGDINK